MSLAISTFKGRKDANGDWTYDTKVDTCALLLQTQNSRKVADITGIPYDTVLTWQKQDWWPQVKLEVERQKRAELKTRLSGIINLALEKIEDRLNHGDYILNNKTGEIERKPVSLRDANAVAKDILGQQINVERLEKEVATDQKNTNDILKALASEFAKFSSKLKKDGAVDIEFKEVGLNAIQEQSTGEMDVLSET